MIFRDLSRRAFLTCSLPTEQVRRIGAVTCSWLIKRRLAYILCFIIRNRRFSFVVCFCFTNAEYLIALVDFIAPCGGTKGRRRRTLRSPSPPSSGLHLLTSGMSAAAGKCRLPRVWGNLVSLCPVQTVCPHFDISFGCFVFGLRSFAFQ